MHAVDTNVLVRLLVRDDPAQTRAAERFVSSGAWVSHLVLAETCWVLSSVYDVRRTKLATAIELLLDHEHLSIEGPEVRSRDEKVDLFALLRAPEVHRERQTRVVDRALNFTEYERLEESARLRAVGERVEASPALEARREPHVEEVDFWGLGEALLEVRGPHRQAPKHEHALEDLDPPAHGRDLHADLRREVGVALELRRAPREQTQHLEERAALLDTCSLHDVFLDVREDEVVEDARGVERAVDVELRPPAAQERLERLVRLESAARHELVHRERVEHVDMCAACERLAHFALEEELIRAREPRHVDALGRGTLFALPSSPPRDVDGAL